LELAPSGKLSPSEGKLLLLELAPSGKLSLSEGKLSSLLFTGDARQLIVVEKYLTLITELLVIV